MDVTPFLTLAAGWALSELTRRFGRAEQLARDEADRREREQLHETERQVEHRRWLRERRADAYISTMTHLGAAIARVSALRRGQPLPEGEADVAGLELLRADALMAAYGTDKVRELSTEGFLAVQDAVAALARYDEQGAKQHLAAAEEHLKRFQAQVEAELARPL